MSFDEWEISFYASLHALLGFAGATTMMATTAGYVFGGYLVKVVRKGEVDCVVWAMENTSGTGLVDAMKWQITFPESDPLRTAEEAADWLRPRLTTST